MATARKFWTMKLTLYLICLALIPSLTSCASLKIEPPPISAIPGWVLVPVEARDMLPESDVTIRHLVSQALEYKRAYRECSARIDYIRTLNE